MSWGRPGSFAASSLVLLLACGGTPPRPSFDAGGEVAPAEARCRPTGPVSASPQSIAEVVALVNALPRPLTLPCFLESLARPLAAQPIVSVVSLQPSFGARNPRIFLFWDKLIVSVVPDGTGRSLLEMGQLVDVDRSLKAELGFPLTEPVEPGTPFARVSKGDGTSCGFCHSGEVPAGDVGGAPSFVSTAFAPTPRALQDLSLLRHERDVCDAAAEPDRCAFLRALFDHGEVRAQAFPAGIPTAFAK
jgi:hypothetical protein